jgi:hypothetical protein
MRVKNSGAKYDPITKGTKMSELVKVDKNKTGITAFRCTESFLKTS